MNEYTIAWIIYLAGCLALMLVGWRITRGWPRLVRHLLLVTCAVWLVTPFSLQLESPAYAPALFIVVFNTLFQGWDSALDAAGTLLVLWVTALVLSLLYLFFTRRRARPPEAPAQENPAR